MLVIKGNPGHKICSFKNRINRIATSSIWEYFVLRDNALLCPTHSISLSLMHNATDLEFVQLGIEVTCPELGGLLALSVAQLHCYCVADPFNQLENRQTFIRTASQGAAEWSPSRFHA